ncbi:MAG TPA: homoserine kinase [Candidatus Udaeobacter sp.]|jgi:homoserine kinase|nr:homoserine kinase [Candidatus Udaeobacter sp.]
MQRVTVRVPASTSNLGPGFDSLGIALRIYNSVTIVRGASRSQDHPQIVAEAADRFFKRTRRRAFSFSYSTAEQIPRSRGLGSSAAVRLGVLLALNFLSENALGRLIIFEMCSELEGHPDNAAPGIFGGFTVTASGRFGDSRKFSGQRGDRTVQRFRVSPHLKFVLLVSPIEIATSAARQLLPLKISHAAAVKSCANACALTAAFAAQDYDKLSGAFDDYLHQPFRTKLIPFLPGVIAAAEKAGALGAFLSGSGSTVAAVTLRAPNKVAAAMAHAAKVCGHTVITRADNRGAQILTSH